MQKEELKIQLEHYKKYTADKEEIQQFAFLLNPKYAFNTDGDNIFDNNYEWDSQTIIVEYFDTFFIITQQSFEQVYDKDLDTYKDGDVKYQFCSIPYDAIVGITSYY